MSYRVTGHLLRRVAPLVAAGGVCCAAHASGAQAPPPARRSTAVLHDSTSDGLLGAIGATPLIELKSLSEATGCRVLAKAEFMSVGGSVKDRAAASIVAAAEASGALVPRHKRRPGEPAGTIVEGTGGNTGITLALIAAARGYKCHFTMPPSTSPEKVETARCLGCSVEVCPSVPFDSPLHFYHRAQAYAKATPGAVWMSQFESAANSAAHETTTGPEIYEQAGGRVDGVVLSSGTGGSVGGISRALRARDPRVRVFLVDPPGSSLASFVESQTLTPTPGDTVTEGVGLGRVTSNFASAGPLDGAFRATNEEVVAMAHYLMRREGLWVGPSAALNVVGAVKLARALGPGKTVVTLLCDGGARYASKVYSPAWLAERGLAAAANVDVERAHADFVLAEETTPTRLGGAGRG